MRPVPSAVELVESVRAWIIDLTPHLDGSTRFGAQVAANTLGIVEREIAACDVEHRRGSSAAARLGFASDADLVGAIRAGRLDESYEDLKSAVVADVQSQLAIDNPGYMGS